MERESRILEYKREVSDLRKLAKTVVAFANGDGGRIVIGVDDRTRKVVGLRPDTVDNLLESIPCSLADSVEPSVFPQIFEKTIEDRETLVVQVFPANQKPCFIASEGLEKGVYIRVGAHTRRAQGEVLEELKLLRSRMAYDEVPIPECPPADLDRKALPVPFRSDKGMHSLGILRHDTVTGSGIPVRGGILMLHPAPERYVPEAYVVASRMRGERGRSTIESHDLNGSVPQQADAAVATLDRWLGREPARRGARYASKRWVLPMDAVREAVNNALLHRNYSIPGPVKIALYATRLEIFSPGHFAGPFVKEALGDGSSYIRNHVMCTVARRLDLIEKRGTGVKLIMDAMHDHGLQPAVFEEGAQWFKVTLHMIQSGRAESARDYGHAVMRLFETVPEVRSADVCKGLGVSKATAVGVLKELIHQGLIKRVGAGPMTRYRPV